MSKSEKEPPNARVEVTEYGRGGAKKLYPDRAGDLPYDKVTEIDVGPNGVDLFEVDNTPNLKALREEGEIVVEASWPSNHAYGLQDGVLVGRRKETKTGKINHFKLKVNKEMLLRAQQRGLLGGYPDSTKITHLYPEQKKKAA